MLEYDPDRAKALLKEARAVGTEIKLVGGSQGAAGLSAEQARRVTLPGRRPAHRLYRVVTKAAGCLSPARARPQLFPAPSAAWGCDPPTRGREGNSWLSSGTV
jgi:hypothetical protein